MRGSSTRPPSGRENAARAPLPRRTRTPGVWRYAPTGKSASLTRKHRNSPSVVELALFDDAGGPRDAGGVESAVVHVERHLRVGVPEVVAVVVVEDETALYDEEHLDRLLAVGHGLERVGGPGLLEHERARRCHEVVLEVVPAALERVRMHGAVVVVGRDALAGRESVDDHPGAGLARA